MTFADTSWDGWRIRYPEEFLRYDRERGEMQTLVDGHVRHAVEVRRGIEDAAVRDAVVAELRRLGYTVTPPGADPLGPNGYSAGRIP